MDQFHFMMHGPILLHHCGACEGLWIYHGQLTQIAQAIESREPPSGSAGNCYCERSAPKPAPDRRRAAGRFPH